MAGLESACVSIAAVPWGEGKPTMGEVEVGLVIEIKGGERILAIRGGGVEPRPSLGTTTEIERMLWTYGFRGRPAVDTTVVLEELIDASSVAGGTSFDALYVDVNGQSGWFSRSLHAYGQEGLPCPRCGRPIRREPFMNRSSYRCPRCQPQPHVPRW